MHIYYLVTSSVILIVWLLACNLHIIYMYSAAQATNVDVRRRTVCE